MSFGRFIALYLKQRIGRIAAALVCAAIFAAVFLLYELPPSALLYPAALSLTVFLIYTIWDVVKTFRKCRFISELARQGVDALPLLPSSGGAEEEAYKMLAARLSDDCAAVKNEAEKRAVSENEYFTLWAHQIKTPLASMRLNLSGEDSRLSRRLNADLTRTEQYVDMAMAYLRLGSENRDLVIKEYPLDDILRAAAKKFAVEFINRRLTLDMEPTSAKVVTDEKWLSFVVEQIFSNSLKYTSQGGIKVYLDKPATLVIEDTGVGIPKEDLPLIFERGYTGISGRTDRHSSGIGLWLCRRVCADLGHGISVDSPGPSGRGTVVKIDLRREHEKHE